MRAYVFIETGPGMAWNVLHTLKKRNCVCQVDVINGPYKVIAVVEGDGASSVAMTILTGIRKLEGVVDVVVYLAEKEGERGEIPKNLTIRQAKKVLNRVVNK